MSGMLTEQPLSFTTLAREHDIHPSTVWRWAHRGVRGVQLESYCVGAKRLTTREAFARFVELTSNAAIAAHTPMARSRDRQRDIAAAKADVSDLIS